MDNRLDKCYVSYETDQIPFFSVEWLGWSTSTKYLVGAGWEQGLFYNRFTKKYVITFYHPVNYMTFKVKVDSIAELKENKVFALKFMAVGGKWKRRPKNLSLSILMSDDVGKVLELALDLQKPYRQMQIKEAELPSADIINLKRVV